MDLACHSPSTVNPDTFNPLYLFYALYTLCISKFVPTMIIGASLSEPHIDEFAVEFVYIYYYYICIVRRAISHFRLLFCEFLLHSLIQNYSPTTAQREDTNRCTSSMATARTETTHGPTYSMTRAIGATRWQKGFICQCHCLRCHYSPLTVEVTRHMDWPLQWPHR